MRNITMLDQDGSGLVSCLRQGNFKSAAVGGGYVITRSTNTAANRLYVDDAGAVLTGTGSVPDLRGSLVRFLLTKDNTGGDIRVHALMGQMKVYDGIWNDEVVSAVHGRLEIVRSAATLTLGGNGISAAVLAVPAISGAVTVNTSHILAGVAAVSDFRATLTQTGKVAAFLAAKYDTTNWSDGTSRTTWGYGLLIPNSAVATGVEIGNCTTGISIPGTSTTGISISGAATDGIKILTGAMTDGIEIASVCTNGVNISGACTAGITISGACTDGIKILTGAQTDGIEIASACTNGINISGTATTSISITGVSTTGIQITNATFGVTNSRAIKVSTSQANAAMSDGYGVVEIDHTITGTAASNFSGCPLSSWVNIPTGTVGAGVYVCAQNNGIWEEVAATVTNAKLIFGMRAQKLIADTDSLSFPFSINTNNTAITAFVDVNNATDMGWVTAALANGAGHVPLFRDAGGTIHYVNTYTS